jgi:hypothetical protein
MRKISKTEFKVYEEMTKCRNGRKVEGFDIVIFLIKKFLYGVAVGGFTAVLGDIVVSELKFFLTCHFHPSKGIALHTKESL